MEWGYAFLISLVLDFIVALLGKRKKMGYWGLFAISLCFSPLVGLVVGLSVPDVQEEKIHEGNQSSRIISELANLKAIKDNGAFSEEEYKKREDALIKKLQDPNIDINPNAKIKLRHNSAGVIKIVNPEEWAKLKLEHYDEYYTPILVIHDRKNSKNITVTINQWNEIKGKGLQDNYKIIEGSDIC